MQLANLPVAWQVYLPGYFKADLKKGEKCRPINHKDHEARGMHVLKSDPNAAFVQFRKATVGGGHRYDRFQTAGYKELAR